MGKGFKIGNKESKGRPKGSLNFGTKEIRDMFKEILLQDIDKIREDIEAIDKPELRVKLRLEIAKFVLPTLKSVEKVNERKIETTPFRIQDIYNTKDEDLD